MDLDFAQLVDGDFPELQPGKSFSLPAAPFFHAGMTDLAKNAAVFRATQDGAGISFYGPKLPCLPGTYEIELAASSPAKAGTVLGAFFCELGGVALTNAPVVAGQATRLHALVRNSLPLNLVFVYSAAADIALERITFKRVE